MPATDAIIVGAGSWGQALAHTLVINKKKIIISFIVFTIIVSSVLFHFTKKELLPMEDRGV